MDTETTPPQPDEVTRAILAALGEPNPAPDPWWQAGTREALGE